MLEVEGAFGDFCSISEEYEAVVMESGLEAHRVVNGEDLHMYRESVTETYDTIVQCITQHLWRAKYCVIHLHYILACACARRVVCLY